MKKFLPLSYSSLKQFAISPNHFLAYKNREVEPTASMIKGTALHTLVLEPETFDDRYYVIPSETRRGTKAFKEFEAQAALRGDGVEIIKESELEPIKRMHANIQDNVHAAELLSSCEQFEMRAEWEFNGLPFHGFVDAAGVGIIVDLKTTQNASERKFLRTVMDMKYHWQAALYSRAANGPVRFFIVAVENTSPYNVVVYEITREFIDLAVRELVEVTERFKKWDGMPQSYTKEVIALTPPNWM